MRDKALEAMKEGALDVVEETKQKFLDNFIPIAPDEIPPTSILREFIGGSSFQY